MLRHGGQRDRKPGGQGRDPGLAARDVQQDRPPRGVGQGEKDSIQRLGSIFNHLVECYRSTNCLSRQQAEKRKAGRAGKCAPRLTIARGRKENRAACRRTFADVNVRGLFLPTKRALPPDRRVSAHLLPASAPIDLSYRRTCLRRFASDRASRVPYRLYASDSGRAVAFADRPSSLPRPALVAEFSDSVALVGRFCWAYPCLSPLRRRRMFNPCTNDMGIYHANKLARAMFSAME